MAKIENTTVYPLTIPSVDDYLIGTDTSDSNRTVSFSISDITATGLLQGLQSVLDTGNIATQNISLTGNITVTGDVYPTTITAQGTAGAVGQVLTSTGTGIQWAVPAAVSCCSLDDTLTIGNTTAQNITTTGSIAMAGAGQQLLITNATAVVLGAGCLISTFSDIILSDTSILNFSALTTISDYANNTGAAGQILTVNAAGTGIEWSTGVPAASTPTLQEVLTAGNVATSIGIIFSGTSATTFAVASTINSFAPNIWQGTNSYTANGTAINTAGIALSGSLWDGASTGTASQVLTSTATGVAWSDVSVIGITDVNVTSPIPATGPLQPITVLTPVPGSRTIRQNIYAGADNIGCVPGLGTPTTFLRGDGTWATPTGTGVTSVSFSNTGVASLGPPLVITPTTGAVVVEAREFAGAALTGVVPDSSAAAQTTTFLRADGTWQTPAGGGAPEWVNTHVYANGKWTVTAGDYFVNPGVSQFGFASSTTSYGLNHGASAPSAVAITDAQVTSNIFEINPGSGACITAFPNHKLCSLVYQFYSDFAATYTLSLWNIPVTGGLANVTPAASVTIAALANTLYTGSFVLDPGGVQNILLPNRGFMLTMQSNTIFSNQLMQLNMGFKYTATA